MVAETLGRFSTPRSALQVGLAASFGAVELGKPLGSKGLAAAGSFPGGDGPARASGTPRNRRLPCLHHPHAGPANPQTLEGFSGFPLGLDALLDHGPGCVDLSFPWQLAYRCCVPPRDGLLSVSLAPARVRVSALPATVTVTLGPPVVHVFPVSLAGHFQLALQPLADVLAHELSLQEE